MLKIKEKSFELWLENCCSTMDEGKNYAQNGGIFLISSKTQTDGRGANDRIWHSSPGNIFMTIGIQSGILRDNRKILLPLETGILLYDVILSHLHRDASSMIKIKWPNDILIENKKVCGVLIEYHEGYSLIGIGINVTNAPEIKDPGRPSVCLEDFGIQQSQNTKLILQIYNKFKKRITAFADEKTIISNWKERSEFHTPVKLRKFPDIEVTPLNINKFGQLLVKFPDGTTKWLTAEYLI
jgi:biotin-[acetyl-CoA-carboxylase] ligase BirA-like protein